MDFLQYNGPEDKKGGSRTFLVFGIILLFFMILPYFMMGRQQADPNAQKPEEAAKTAVEETPQIVVAHKIDPRTIETDDYKLVMTNAGGGRASSFVIKNPDRYFEHGEYIVSQKPEKETQGGLLPFAVTLNSFGISPETSFETISNASNTREAKFRFLSTDALYQFDKTFSATDTPYVIHAKFALTNRSTQTVTDNLSIALSIFQNPDEEPGMFTPGSFVAAKCYSDGEMEYLDATDKNEKESYNKDLKWFGIDESYFAIAMTAEYASSCDLKNEVLNATGNKEDEKSLVTASLQVPVSLAPNTTATYEYDIYMGPKESRYLAEFGEERDLPAIIDYGWIEVLAKPMAWILDKFHEWTGNWGIAIIILTLIVRGLLWPIAQKSQLSMMRMSKIAPLMQEIQEKYKDDPQTMQQKQLELYQTHKINPFGCLPLLLQMPVFFALYRCIFVTGGLYHAPFCLWIHDLSAPDPWFILPLLSGGMLIVQQLLSPSTAKNTQQKVMMYSMPVMFIAMMLFLPSGLCLYMVVSSSISMVQSFYVRRIIARENEEEAAQNESSGDKKEGIGVKVGKDGVIDIENLSSKDKRAAKRREEDK